MCGEVIFGLVAAGLHIAIDIVLLCISVARRRKNKEGIHNGDNR